MSFLFKNVLKRGQTQLSIYEGQNGDDNNRLGNNHDLMYRLEDEHEENRV